MRSAATCVVFPIGHIYQRLLWFVNGQIRPDLWLLRPDLWLLRPDLWPITFLSLKNKAFQRPELIEHLEQERRCAFLNFFWCFLVIVEPFQPNFRGSGSGSSASSSSCELDGTTDPAPLSTSQSDQRLPPKTRPGFRAPKPAKAKGARAAKPLFAAPAILSQGYVRASFSDRGMVADWVIHDKSDGNPHAHIMLTTRELGAADWGRKRHDWNARDVLSGLRSDWAQHANLALERAGFDERIDHRSNHARGIYLEPDSYNPHVADHARRQGETAREALRCSDVAQANALYLQQHPGAYSGGGAGAAGGVYQGRYRSRVPRTGCMLTKTELAGLVARGNGLGRGGASGAEQPRWPGAIRHHGPGLRSAAPGNPHIRGGGSRHNDCC